LLQNAEKGFRWKASENFSSSYAYTSLSNEAGLELWGRRIMAFSLVTKEACNRLGDRLIDRRLQEERGKGLDKLYFHFHDTSESGGWEMTTRKKDAKQDDQ
jgi:hypothetical protein